MYKIPANTLFLGKNMIYVPQCHSTNTLASELSRQEIHEGTVVITDDQTAGRGQRGSSWESAPGMNLTFSVVLHPHFLKAMEQFKISQVVALAISDYLIEKTHATVAIKWPNDILINDKKICGVLIENQLSGMDINHSIIGIGLNINQPSFENPKATSLRKVSGASYILGSEMALLLGCIEARYLLLKRGDEDMIERDYEERLYRINELHRYTANGVELEGMIKGVDAIGKLRVEVDGSEQLFDLKEIAFVI